MSNPFDNLPRRIETNQAAYKLQRELGVGGFGKVFLAKVYRITSQNSELEISQKVAIKIQKADKKLIENEEATLKKI